MKKLMSLVVAGVALFALSGCGGGDTYVVDDGPIPETYFITDDFGLGVGNIIYHCDSGLSGITNFEGAFTFDIRGDNCNFDFFTNDIIDNLYLEYSNDPNIDTGLNGIYFECVRDGRIELTGDTGDIISDGFIADASLYDGCTLFDIY